VDDERWLGTARLEIVNEFGDDTDIIAIFAAADDHAIDLAITNQRIEGANEFGSVRTPTVTKGVSLLSRGAAIVHPQDFRWPIRCEMRPGWTSHQP
jgi:hypothetical protein